MPAVCPGCGEENDASGSADIRRLNWSPAAKSNILEKEKVLSSSKLNSSDCVVFACIVLLTASERVTDAVDAVGIDLPAMVISTR